MGKNTALQRTLSLRQRPKALEPLPTLSAAIRTGATLRPQATGDYVAAVEGGTVEACAYLSDGSPWIYATCAQGAAFEALCGMLPNHDWIERRVEPLLRATFRLANRKIPFPPGMQRPVKRRTSSVLFVVATMNDGGFTREEIAAYLEQHGL